MKRKALPKLIVIVSLVAALAIVVPMMSSCLGKPAAAPPPAPAAEEPIYHWRVQTISSPAQTPITIQPWIDSLEEALGGRVVIDLYSGGELVPGTEAIEALQAGTLDINLGVAIDWSPPLDIIDLMTCTPFAYESAQEALTLMNERGLGEIYAEAYEELGGIKYLGSWITDPMHLYSTRPIQKYEDLEGLKVGVFGPVGTILENAGALPIWFPQEDLYLAGQTGTLDAIAYGGAVECFVNSFQEVYPYFLTNPVCGAYIASILINEDLYNSVPDDIRTILDWSTEVLSYRLLSYYYSNESMQRPLLDLTTMPDEDWAKLKEDAIEMWDEMAETSPRCAEVVRIFEEYNEEVETGKWFR